MSYIPAVNERSECRCFRSYAHSAMQQNNEISASRMPIMIGSIDDSVEDSDEAFDGTVLAGLEL